MDEDHLTIYVRNTFRVKWNRGDMFLTGKENFIRETKRKWTLIAAFSEWPLLRDGRLAERDMEAVQIWKVKDWSVLYKTMTAFSEREWYRKLGTSLASESHDFLINATARNPQPRIHWRSDSDPGYAYVYEQSRPREHQTHAYLRDSYWFTARMADAPYGWRLVWCASQITSQPAELAFLWRVPNPKGANPKDEFQGNKISQDLVDLVNQEETRDRYKHMMGRLQATKRQILYPIFTEHLAQQEHQASP